MKFYFQFLLLLFISCSDKKQIFYDMENLGNLKHSKYEYENYLRSNYFIFYNSGRLYVAPIAFYFDESEATWDIKMNNNKINSLIIKTENELYNGNYKIRFLINNTNSRLFMELKSDSLEIVLYNYFRTIKERDSYISRYDIETIKASEDYFPQLKQFPDNRKTFD